MAKHATDVIKMLTELAEKQVSLATEALAHAMRAEREAQSKHDVLDGYRQDYVSNLNRLLQTGMTRETHLNYQNFIAKLDDAIKGQLDVIAAAAHEVKLKRGLWQESQRKKLSYEVLSNRSEQRELKVEQKRDQKLMDEFAMRAGRSR
jgi:flagellar FliJ protein